MQSAEQRKRQAELEEKLKTGTLTKAEKKELDGLQESAE